MTGLEFIKKYLENRPDKLKMELSGVPIKIIARFLNAFDIMERTAIYNNKTTFQIELLFNNFDLSIIEIGAFSFLPELDYSNDFCVFGNFDTERMAINVKTGEIVMLDENTDFILCICSPNESLFFESMVICSEYYKNMKETNFNYPETPNQRVETILNIVGRDYKDFYCILLGCD